jgi:hypothetical protein
VAGVFPCICIGPSHVFLSGDFIFAVVIAGFVLHRFRLSIRVQVLERTNLVQLFCYGRPVRRVQARDFSLLEHRISVVISFSVSPDARASACAARGCSSCTPAGSLRLFCFCLPCSFLGAAWQDSARVLVR